MRWMAEHWWLGLLFAGGTAFFACGGEAVIDGTSADGGASATGSSSASSAGRTCDELIERHQELANEAVGCDPDMGPNDPQCMRVYSSDYLCCAQRIRGDTLVPTLDELAEAAAAQGCTLDCPDIPCPSVEGDGFCQGNNGRPGGLCVTLPP